MLNTAGTGTGSVSKLLMKAMEKPNWERSSCSSQIANGLERGLFSWRALQCFIRGVNNLWRLIWQTVCFLPKLGVKCARRTSRRKLPIRIPAQFPTLARLLLLLLTRGSSQPTGLCQCSLVPSKTCAGAAVSTRMPQITILSCSSCRQCKRNTGSMSERGTCLEKACFWVVLVSCSPIENHKTDCLLFGAKPARDN